jgi:hypothetical protein
MAINSWCRRNDRVSGGFWGLEKDEVFLGGDIAVKNKLALIWTQHNNRYFSLPLFPPA